MLIHDSQSIRHPFETDSLPDHYLFLLPLTVNYILLRIIVTII